MSVLESLRQHLPTYTLLSVIGEIRRWAEAGRSCFVRLAEKPGLIGPGFRADGRPSLLDHLIPRTERITSFGDSIAVLSPSRPRTENPNNSQPANPRAENGQPPCKRRFPREIAGVFAFPLQAFPDTDVVDGVAVWSRRPDIN